MILWERMRGTHSNRNGLTAPLIHRVRSFRLGIGVVEPFRALTPGVSEIRIAA
jgi:hypothetical protein